MLSAQKHDSPRWGDFPEKTNLTYIGGLIQNGEWFDGTSPFLEVADWEQEKFYAPKFIMDRPEKFGYLIQAPSYVAVAAAEKP